MNNLNIHHVTKIQITGITTLEDTENNEFSSWREIKFTCMNEGKEETFTVSMFSNVSSNMFRTIDALAVAISQQGKTINKGDK